ncbi:MAG: hypothetical protein M0C28_21865 [Candidatus Moduliflexus flocculans]|nr:hypothetical protein [Candidatus Moduliflexus flocculans]
MDPVEPPVRSAGLRKMAVIGPAAFLNSLGIGSVNLGLIFILREVFQAPPAVVGRLGALWSLVYFAACLALPEADGAPRAAELHDLHDRLVRGHHPAPLRLPQPARGLPRLLRLRRGHRLLPGLPSWAGCSRGPRGKEAVPRATGLFSFSWSAGGIVSPYLAGTLSERGQIPSPLVRRRDVHPERGHSSRPRSACSGTRTSGRSPGAPGSRTRPGREHSPALFRVGRGDRPVRGHRNPRQHIPAVRPGGAGTVGIAHRPADHRTYGGHDRSGFLVLGRFSFWRFREGLLFLPTALAGGAALLLAFCHILPAPPVGRARGCSDFAAAWAYNNSMFYGASGRSRPGSAHDGARGLCSPGGQVSWVP